MRAAARLMLTFFAGNPLLLAVSACGLAAAAGGSLALIYLPPLLGGQGLPSRFSLAQEGLLMLLPVTGILGIAFGAALMPTMAARLATSHYLCVLPHGRIRLLASVFGTVVLVAALASATASVYYVRTTVPLDVVFQRAFAVSLLSYTILYGVLWLTGRSSSAIAKLVGTAALIATLTLPLRFIAVPSTSLVGPWIACALLWAALALGFLLAPQLQAAVGRAKNRLARRFGASYGGGGEIEFLIGTANPWPLALGQIAPILIAAHYVGGYQPLAAEAPPNPWLFFMTILSVLSGATASLAATRSRSLWLRTSCTRAELFARVERAFWRYNAYPLGVLLVMLVAVGEYLALPTSTIAFGLGLLTLGTTLSLYLGLTITSTIGWLQAGCAAFTMLGLMIVAIYASSPATPVATIVALELALATLGVVFRYLARRRWSELDWMLCRPEAHSRVSA
jgi:hypothetical protein